VNRFNREAQGASLIMVLVLLAVISFCGLGSFKNSVMQLNIAQQNRSAERGSAALDASIRCLLSHFVTDRERDWSHATWQRGEALTFNVYPIESGCQHLYSVDGVTLYQFNNVKVATVLSYCGYRVQQVAVDQWRMIGREYLITVAAFNDEWQRVTPIVKRAWAEVIPDPPLMVTEAEGNLAPISVGRDPYGCNQLNPFSAMPVRYVAATTTSEEMTQFMTTPHVTDLPLSGPMLRAILMPEQEQWLIEELEALDVEFAKAEVQTLGWRRVP